MATNWKNLATAEAQAQGADINIVLATVEAETNGTNILGDGGNALGYGQVWPKWHEDSFLYAANKLRLELPDSLEGMQQLTLSNDAFSMCVAVRVISRVWKSAGKDFRKFTLSYVGPAIPDSDYQRRYRVWLKYQGDSSSGAGATTPTLTTPQFNINVPATNFGVVANSQALGNILYGRRYRVLVSRPDGVALDVSQLRCTFKIQKTILQQPNFSEIVLYNLAPDTENSIIQEGNRIVIEAGYEGDQYGLIFDGDIIQPVRDKEDGVTYRLTLYSLDGDRFMNQGFVGFSVLKGQSSRSLVENVVSQAKIPTLLGSISSEFSSQELSRGKVVFGLAKDYLRQLAQSQDASFYVEDGKVNIVRMSDLPEGEITELSPASGLIGMPAQNDQGVTFKCLLNPRIKINTLVHINNSLIRAQTFQQGQPIRNLDGDGIYRVIGVTYTGDTRGDAWECECQTVSQAGILPGMISAASANPM
ncbi:hypothetical protein GC093_20470 [Paenibacillus sp. LMG 31456]|uniref:Uncharacterized protein n=1 Tax=Paenibacillus foliorum TaxID=2654974 RepID=A0A972K1D3_9BACL|nr:hypothetical protein [Paenibacillus foliorum]NOU95586.1 hypothetical protein [Paenibacillus foliorum]